ncbi:uncharacterized protein DS421_11g351180 [Arachis hypogaea]|nr:uncharacterized protein DS421_11g351180 [Arachis hypogaea]
MQSYSNKHCTTNCEKNLYLGLVEDREECRAGGDRDNGWQQARQWLKGWKGRTELAVAGRLARRQVELAVAAISTADRDGGLLPEQSWLTFAPRKLRQRRWLDRSGTGSSRWRLET